MRAEILTSLIGRFQGGSSWKVPLFFGISVTASKDSDFTQTIVLVTLTAVCSTPGVNFEWRYNNTLYDVNAVTFVFPINPPGPDVYTVIVTDPITGAHAQTSVTVFYTNNP